MNQNYIHDLWPGWDVVRELGSGSFGTVYEITQEVHGRKDRAALKVISIPKEKSEIAELRADDYDDASITRYFADSLYKVENEYAVMLDMKGHPNIVYCEDLRKVQHDDGFGWDIYIKMELLTSLKDSLKSKKVDEKQVIRLGMDMCSALSLCQEMNVVHRDIKPENIFVTRSNSFKLGDFGIARTMEKTSGGTRTGTYDYMAPEVYNNQPYHLEADIYSLGLVLYWMLNEFRLPFVEKAKPTGSEKASARERRATGETIPAPKHGSEALKTIVLKACAYDPKERYANPADMKRELEALLYGRQTAETESVSESVSEEEPEEETIGPNIVPSKEMVEEDDSRTVGPVIPLRSRNKKPVGVVAAVAAAAILIGAVAWALVPRVKNAESASENAEPIASASEEASVEVSVEPVLIPTAQLSEAPGTEIVTLDEGYAEQIDVADLTASTYYTLTNYTNRDDTGNIILGYAYKDGAASDEANFQAEGNNVVLNQEVVGPAYTAVFAQNSDVNVTGTLIGRDDTDGQLANDFNGIGSLIIAYDGSTINVTDANISGQGFDRSAFIVSQNSVITVKDSYAEAIGKNPLTEAYPEYVNSANQNIMLSPPWVLGLMGGSRVLNMIGATPTFNAVNSEFVSGGWALLSTDSGSNMMLNIVDTEMSVLPASEGGMDSGWRILGYDEDAYGSGYGAYYIGNPTQNYYGVTMNGVTYAAIITGAEAGLYTSSEGEIELYDAQGNYLETVQGKGQPTVINGVFGIMMHNSLANGMIFNEGTTMNVEEAGIIYKAGNGDFYFDDAVINSKSGILVQMMDNDDDARIGMISMADGFSTEYDESKVESGIGFPGINYDYTSDMGGDHLTITLTNGIYNGDIFNGTGYYEQKGDHLTVILREGAVLNGNIALTSTIKGIPYSSEAIEGIAYYGDDISYVLLDAEGNETTDEAEAAYIQFTSYTINQYFLQGHVENKNYYNGTSTIEVIVEDGAIWNVTGESLITSLSVAIGGEVKGDMTENADGTINIVADTIADMQSVPVADKTVPATVTETDYQAYLKAYVDTCPYVSNDQYAEFAALIDAGDYVSFPVEMCFVEDYWGHTAVALDVYLEANGNIELPAW